MNDNTAITHHEGGGTTLEGDAIVFFRAVTIQKAIKLYIKTKMLLTRGATIGHLLKLAAEITKPKAAYKNNAGGWQLALDDLTAWVETLKAAIPHIDGKTGEIL